MRRLTLLLTTLAALTSLGNAQDAANEPVGIPDTLSVLAGSSITCSTAWPSATVGCWWERPVLVLGDVEVAIALDAQLVLNADRESYLAPMLSVSWYGQDASVWLEAALPGDWLPVPHVGRSDWLRIGVSWRL